MGTANRPRPISLPQLRGIARAILNADPDIDTTDWAEAIKCTLIRQGWTYPEPRWLLHEAMYLTERTSRRQVPVPPTPTPAPAAPPPLSPEEARAAVATLTTRLGSVPPIKPMPKAKVLTRREAERRRALQLVAQAIQDQVATCEAAERAVEDWSHAHRDLQRGRGAAAEGQHESVRAEVVGAAGGGGRDRPEGHRDE